MCTKGDANPGGQFEGSRLVIIYLLSAGVTTACFAALRNPLEPMKVGLVHMVDNNPFQLFEDIGKGIAETAEAAVKTVRGGAAMVIDGVGGAVEGIANVVTGGEQDKSLPQKNDAPKYRNNSEVVFNCRGIEKLSVQEVYLDEEGHECEGPDQEIRLSKKGVELYSENGRKSTLIRSMNISDIDLFKNGKTEGGDSMRNAAMYRAMSVASGDGPFPGAAIGFFCTPRPEDIWCVRIKEHDGSVHVYRLLRKDSGDTLVTFLDTYARI